MGLLLDFEMGDTVAAMAVPRTVAEKVPVCACVRACVYEGPKAKAGFCYKGRRVFCPLGRLPRGGQKGSHS